MGYILGLMVFEPMPNLNPRTSSWSTESWVGPFYPPGSSPTKGLAREFAPLGIRINAVLPGTVDTGYHRQFSTAQALEAVVKATPMGQLGTAAEVADVVAFLCTDKARFVQGQVIEVNGGFLMV